jgi:hypothetical protein
MTGDGHNLVRWSQIVAGRGLRGSASIRTEIGRCWTAFGPLDPLVSSERAPCARHPHGQKAGKWQPPSDDCRMDTNDPKQNFGSESRVPRPLVKALGPSAGVVNGGT